MLIKRRMNKKGQMTLLLILLVLGLFVAVVFLLVGGIVMVRINNALDQDIDVGQVNLADINADTFGHATTMYLNNADWWGICLIFGMVLGIFLSAYILRNQYAKWMIILDIFIIVAVFMIALYMSSTYQTLLDALANVGEDFLEAYTPKTSLFFLNLPIFIPIIGVIAMVLSHSSIPKRREERLQEGGYLQGSY